MHEKCLKKGGIIWLTSTRRQNLQKNLGRKWQTLLRLDWLRKRSQKAFKNVWTMWWTRERKTFLKTHWLIFDQSKIRFDRSKSNFDRSSTNRARKIVIKVFIALSIDQIISSIDWKSEKISFFKNRAF